MSRPFRAVVFDLDGTLVDSMPMVLKAYAHAVSPYFPQITADELRSHMGGPPERIFARMFTDAERALESLGRLNEFGAANWRLIRLFAGASELLDHLRANGQKIAVWTGRERLSTRSILSENGIAGKIDACVCGDDLDSHKPDPAGLAEVMRQLGVNRDETLFLGDADVDVLAGRAMGVTTLLISHGYAFPDLVKTQAWGVVETPEEAYAQVRDAVDSVPKRVVPGTKNTN